ncbi:MAG TPA: tetratricopeptide repeat protein [Acetobacteraceae bacterium]|nr:tetratricopeptide repeat protein [Acetobacteraceae bacterium]
MRLLPLFLVSVVLAAPAGPALAQVDSREGIELQNQILELRHELQDMQAQGQTGGGAPAVAAPAPSGGDSSNISADLLLRVSQLEDQVRTLRGRVEELSNQQQQQNADLAKQIGDLNFRLQQGGAAGAAGGAAAAASGNAQTPAPAAAPNPAADAPTPAPAAPPHRTPENAMQQGNAALARRDYAAAEASAREVLGSGRAGPRANDARFLLAQAEFGQRQYQQAAADYYDAYNRAPHANRAPDALLGVAHSLIALNDNRDACQALAKLHTEFPSARADVHKASVALRTRAGCR